MGLNPVAESILAEVCRGKFSNAQNFLRKANGFNKGLNKDVLYRMLYYASLYKRLSIVVSICKKVSLDPWRAAFEANMPVLRKTLMYMQTLHVFDDFGHTPMDYAILRRNNKSIWFLQSLGASCKPTAYRDAFVFLNAGCVLPHNIRFERVGPYVRNAVKDIRKKEQASRILRLGPNKQKKAPRLPPLNYGDDYKGMFQSSEALDDYDGIDTEVSKQVDTIANEVQDHVDTWQESKVQELLAIIRDSGEHDGETEDGWIALATGMLEDAHWRVNVAAHRYVCGTDATPEEEERLRLDDPDTFPELLPADWPAEAFLSDVMLDSEDCLRAAAERAEAASESASADMSGCDDSHDMASPGSEAGENDDEWVDVADDHDAQSEFSSFSAVTMGVKSLSTVCAAGEALAAERQQPSSGLSYRDKLLMKSVPEEEAPEPEAPTATTDSDVDDSVQVTPVTNSEVDKTEDTRHRSSLFRDDIDSDQRHSGPCDDSDFPLEWKEQHGAIGYRGKKSHHGHAGPRRSRARQRPSANV
eukprot:Rmarinus@m.23365